jgi:hypothetical protein
MPSKQNPSLHVNQMRILTPFKGNRWNGQLPQNVYADAPIPFLNVSK